MPFPGEGFKDGAEPFSVVQQDNAAALASVGAGPAPTTTVENGVGFPTGLAGSEAAISVEGLPTHLTDPGSFVPNPETRVTAEMAAMSLANPETAPTNQLTDEQIVAAQAQEHPNLDLADAKQLKCPECDMVNKISNKACKSCGHDLAAAKKTMYRNLDQQPSQSDEESLVKIYQLALAQDAFKKSIEQDGLVWKIACKTGTLALSPGPGQVDLEQPLNLTGELLRDMVTSLDQKAMSYCTVPETHANGALENTGYVRKAEVLSQEQALSDPRVTDTAKAEVSKDPVTTEYLLSGIEFTEPDVKGKALRGSIPDTSIGVKFNFRNKRTGNFYKAAWEHLALTPVPWVDGLGAFGMDQSGVVFDAEDAMTRYDGVFIDQVELSHGLPDQHLDFSGVKLDPNKHPRTKGQFRKIFHGEASVSKGPFEGGKNNLTIQHPYGESTIALKLHEENKVRDALMAGGEHNIPIHDSGKVVITPGEGGTHDLYIEHPYGNNAVNLTDSERQDLASGLGDIPPPITLPIGTEVNLKDSIQSPNLVQHKGQTGHVVDTTTTVTPLGPVVSMDVQFPSGIAKVYAEDVNPVGEDMNPAGSSFSLPRNGDDSQRGILPEAANDGTIQNTPSSEEETGNQMTTTTVEELLASQQAQSEAAVARIAELENNLQLAQGQIRSGAEIIHAGEVAKRVSELEGKVPPSILLAAKLVWMADKPNASSDDEGMNLSVTVAPKQEGETGTEVQFKSASDVVDFMLSAQPERDHDSATTLATLAENMSEFHASAAAKDDTAKDKVDAWERENHPERFEDDGKGNRK